MDLKDFRAEVENLVRLADAESMQVFEPLTDEEFATRIIDWLVLTFAKARRDIMPPVIADEQLDRVADSVKEGLDADRREAKLFQQEEIIQRSEVRGEGGWARNVPKLAYKNDPEEVAHREALRGMIPEKIEPQNVSAKDVVQPSWFDRNKDIDG
jgi:hypothetical protein